MRFNKIPKYKDNFDDELVRHQIEYLSLINNLRIRRAGFAYKKPYKTFFKRYKLLCPTTWPRYKESDDRLGTIELCGYLNYQEIIDFSLGK